MKDKIYVMKDFENARKNKEKYIKILRKILLLEHFLCINNKGTN